MKFFLYLFVLLSGRERLLTFKHLHWRRCWELYWKVSADNYTTRELFQRESKLFISSGINGGNFGKWSEIVRKYEGWQWNTGLKGEDFTFNKTIEAFTDGPKWIALWQKNFRSSWGFFGHYLPEPFFILCSHSVAWAFFADSF